MAIQALVAGSFQATACLQVPFLASLLNVPSTLIGTLVVKYALAWRLVLSSSNVEVTMDFVPFCGLACNFRSLAPLALHRQDTSCGTLPWNPIYTLVYILNYAFKAAMNKHMVV